MQNIKKILPDTVLYFSVAITFLLPLKFGTMAGLPEVTIPLQFSDIITSFIHIWPPALFTLISGILLILTLIVSYPDDERQSENEFITTKMPFLNIVIPISSFLLFIGSLPGIINASVYDFPVVQILHFSGITAYASAVYIIIYKRPESKIYFLNAIAASTAVITMIGLQQYFYGFKETLSFIQQQEAKTGVKISSEIMNRLLQTRIYATFSLCNSLAAHLILTVPVTIFSLFKYPSTLKSVYTAVVLYFIIGIAPEMKMIEMVASSTVLLFLGVLIYKSINNKFHIFKLLISIPLLLCMAFVFRYTGSRAAMLAEGITILFIIFSAEVKAKIKYITAALALILCSTIFFSDVLSRSLASMNVRFDYYRVAWYMFVKYPFWGDGWGDFFHTYTKIKNFPGTEAPHTPHNYILSFASQCGIIGLISALLMSILPFLIFFKYNNSGKNPKNANTLLPQLNVKFFNITIISGFLAWLIHSALDLNIQVPGTVATLFVMLLFLTTDKNNEKNAIPQSILKHSKAIKLTLVIPAIILIFSAYNRLQAEKEFFILKELSKMQSLTKSSDKRKYIYEKLIKRQLMRTTSIMENSPYPWAEAGLSAMKAGNCKDGEKYFKNALKLSPERSLYYQNLSQCQIKNGKIKEAEKNHKKAVELFPNALLHQKRSLPNSSSQ